MYQDSETNCSLEAQEFAGLYERNVLSVSSNIDTSQIQSDPVRIQDGNYTNPNHAFEIPDENFQLNNRSLQIPDEAIHPRLFTYTPNNTIKISETLGIMKEQEAVGIDNSKVEKHHEINFSQYDVNNKSLELERDCDVESFYNIEFDMNKILQKKYDTLPKSIIETNNSGHRTELTFEKGGKSWFEECFDDVIDGFKSFFDSSKS